MKRPEPSKLTQASSPSVFVNGEVVNYADLVHKLLKNFDDQRIEQLHEAIGIHTEAGEVADIIKAHTIYTKDFDRVALIKELGDVAFWLQALLNRYLITWEDVFQCNADKLAERYVKLQYSDQAAIARVDKKWVIREKSTLGHAAGPFEHQYEAEQAFDNYGFTDLFEIVEVSSE